MFMTIVRQRVIVVNDGSTDATPQIAGEYGVRLITTENRGLSAARNTGWQQATGEFPAGSTKDDNGHYQEWARSALLILARDLHDQLDGAAPIGQAIRRVRPSNEDLDFWLDRTDLLMQSERKPPLA